MKTGDVRILNFALIGVILALTVTALAACGSSGEEGGDSDAARPASTAAAPIDTPETTPAPVDTPRPTPTQPAATPTETQPAETPPATTPSRAAGEIEGITFVVGEGSEATFTVTEQLASLPLPNDAVMRTTALSGEVHLDGRDSVVEIDLQQLSSDNSFRDRYTQSRMFGEHPTGVFTVEGLDDLPGGFTDGETVTGQIEGELLIRGITVPLTFDVEARDDGDAIHVLGRTAFTWDEMQIPKPTARSVVSIEDEVRVEVLLAITP